MDNLQAPMRNITLDIYKGLLISLVIYGMYYSIASLMRVES